MKYTEPTYKLETIESQDIILASDIGGIGVVFNEVNAAKANVTASIYDVLGMR